MQNFTLGKKGISMLFLTFILLIGSLPSFGQTCPTVANTPSTQTFCYLATVGDIVTDGSAVYQTANTVTDTQPIPSDQILNDATYFVGSQSGSCARIAVNVTVNTVSYPNNTLYPGENSFTISPCSSTFTAEELATYFTAISGYEIKVYDTEFGATEASGQLIPNASYFVGQVSTTPTSTPDNCPSLRVAVGYDPQPTPPPTATSPQTFCEGATVADLEAEGTSPNTTAIRWYRSATSFQPLPQNTVLINGETYYATQVINDRNSPLPPCESEGRTPVTVIVDDSIAGDDNTGLTFCRSEFPATVQPAEVEAFFRSLLSQNANPNGTFISSTIAELTEQFNTGGGTGVFSTNYTVGVEECENTALLSVTINPSANAGEDNTATTFCRSQLAETTSAPEVEAFFRSLLSGADPDGTFSPSFQEIADSFNNGTGVGVFSTTYSVTSNGCTDTAFLSVTVTDPDAGDDNTGTEFCRAALPETLSEEEVRNFFLSLLSEGATQGGSFSGQTIAEITESFNSNETFPITYSTTYTVGEGECQDSAFLSVTVNDVEEANAGSFADETFCSNDGMIDLTTLTNQDPNAISGGVFSGTGVQNNQFDTSIGEGDYEITYTVNETTGCGATGSTTFTITVEPAPFSGNINDNLCVTDARLLITDSNSAITYLSGLLTGIDIVINPDNFTPDAQAEGLRLFNYIQNTPSDSDSEEFNFTYIDPAQGDACEDGVISISITVENTQPATVEPISNIAVCSSNEAFDLNTVIGNNTPGGAFTMDDTVITNGLLDVSQLGSYNITYTVSEEDEASCVSGSDSTQFTVTVSNNAANAGTDNTSTVFCRGDLATSISAEEVETFFRSLLSADAQPGGTFSPDFATIADNFNNGTGVGVFSTTYTVGTGDCQDSATLSATVNETTEADAGTIANTTVCSGEEAFNLNSLLTGDNTPNGTFSLGDAVITDGLFDVSEEGVFTITYTVSEADEATCVTGTASTQFTFTVSDTVNAGSDNTSTVFCRGDLAASISAEEVETFFRSLLSADAQPGGTFSPDFATIANNFNNGTGVGVFSTTYTVGTGDCQDSATLSATVNETTEADAGTIANTTVCSSEEAFNLNSLLTGDNTPNGTFSIGDAVITDGLFDVSEEGVFTITYTVSEADEATCVTGTASTQFTVTVNEGDVFVGTPGTGVVCLADVATTFPTVEAATTYLLNLLDDNVSRDGEFSTPVVQFFNQLTGTGDFTITYTLGEGECQASVGLTVRIVESANAGTDGSVTLNENDAPVNLFNYLGGNPTAGGTWSPGNGTFNPATDAPGIYTYTVGSTSCQDSATVTVTVTPDPTECEGLAGVDNSIEVCNSEVRNLNETSVRDLYLSLLEEGVPTNGTFNPSIPALINQFNMVSNYGDFTSTYTVVDGECSDSVVLTVTVLEANDAGADMNLTFCSTDAAVNLFDFLSPFATTNGTFTGYANGTFNPSTATLGVTTITYVVADDNSECSQDNFTSTFTVTVSAPQTANAGGDQAVTYCVENTSDIQLTTILGEGAITTGTFAAPYANGVFNPSTAGVGVYPITYTVAGDCITGTATATITITVAGTPPAPVAAAAQSFCIVDSPTVADLEAEGEGTLTWYSNADLTTVAPATTPLTNNAVFYVVSSTGDSECETSDAVSVTVTLNTEVSPTVQTDGNEFCRQDNPTIADLIANLNGTAIKVYTSNTGGTPLATTVELQDGVTYFATSTNATTGCESDERRAVNVEVGFCGIPEGFSPNGDERNDRFVIPDIAEDYPNYTIEIFNRWGNVVFKGNANTPDWDGVSNQSTTLGDKVLPAGVYFYIVNYNDGSTPPVQGKLYLSR